MNQGLFDGYGSVKDDPAPQPGEDVRAYIAPNWTTVSVDSGSGPQPEAAAGRLSTNYQAIAPSSWPAASFFRVPRSGWYRCRLGNAFAINNHTITAYLCRLRANRPQVSANIEILWQGAFNWSGAFDTGRTLNYYFARNDMVFFAVDVNLPSAAVAIRFSDNTFIGTRAR